MIRRKTDGDIRVIRKVLTAGFRRPAEATLVDGEVRYAPAFAALG